MGDRDIRRELAASDRSNDLFITNEGEMIARILFGPTKATRDDFGGSVVTTHRIEGEADSAVRRAHCALGVGDVRVRRRSADDLAAAIGSALKAGMVRTLDGVALRAAIHGRELQGMVRTSVTLTCMRLLPLRYAHDFLTSLVGARLGAPWRGILPDRRAFVPLRGEESGEARQSRVELSVWAGTGGVMCTAKAAALWAGWRAEQHQASGEIQRLQGESTNINAAPLADSERLRGCMPGLKYLFVDRGAELCCGRCETTAADPFLTPPHASNDAYATIRSVNSNVSLGLEEFVVESLLNGKRFEGEGAPRRFGQEWRKIDRIEGRHRRRRLVLHELCL